MPPWIRAIVITTLVAVAPGCRDQTPVEIDEPSSTIPDEAGRASTTGAPDATGETIGVRVVDGEVRGVSDRVEVAVGTPITIVVEADIADHVHVHGYEALVDVAPGSRATIELTADLAGVWEVELEGAGLLLFQLVVQ